MKSADVKVRTTWGFKRLRAAATKHMRCKRTAQSMRLRGRTAAADVGLHVKSASVEKPCSSQAAENEREGVCVALCELCVGQLLLLAQFTRTAWWLHGTVTPCPHVPVSLTNVAYDIMVHSP